MQVDAGTVDEDFGRFCVDAHPRLVAALAHHCGDAHLAEELAQEALIRAGDRWGTVRLLDSPLGWTFRVGANLAASSFRRRGAERRALDRVRSAGRADGSEADGGDALAVRQALAGLNDRQRRVVVMRYYLDLSADQVAEVMGIRSGAVRMLSHRALAHLRSELSDHDDVEVRHG
jgi:RNA polymerase sigma factor (sigma-70 family)